MLHWTGLNLECFCFSIHVVILLMPPLVNIVLLSWWIDFDQLNIWLFDLRIRNYFFSSWFGRIDWICHYWLCLCFCTHNSCTSFWIRNWVFNSYCYILAYCISILYVEKLEILLMDVWIDVWFKIFMTCKLLNCKSLVG